MSSHTRRRDVLKGIGAAGVVGLAGCLGGDGGDGSDGGSTDGGSQRTVTVGHLNPLSGPYESLGTSNEEGFAARVERYNQSDDVLPNTTIELVSRDTEASPDVANRAARELVIQEGVDLLAGTVSSSVGASVLSFAAEENVPYFMTGPTDRSLTSGANCNRVGFRAYPHSKQIGRPVGEFSVDTYGSDGYILVEDYSYGQAVREAVTEAAESAGGNIVGSSAVELGASEFQGVIDDAESSGADWFLMGAVSGAATSFLSQAANRGFDIPITSQYLVESVLGQVTQDQFESLPEIHTLLVAPEDAEVGSNQEFIQWWRDEMGSAPDSNNYYAYINASWVGGALAETDEVSTDAIVDAAEDLTIDSPLGDIPTRECDHQTMPPVWIGQATGIDEEESLANYQTVQQYDTAEYLVPCSDIECQME
jgi:branched-chain amino acid transport system substrate-binding protein